MKEKIAQITDDFPGSLTEEGIRFTFRAEAKPDTPSPPDKVLFIPMNIMIIDLYERGILTPIEKMVESTGGDTPAYFSWKFTRHYEERLPDREYPPEFLALIEGFDLKQKIITRCILAAAAYERMTDFPPIHFEKASEEIIKCQDGTLDPKDAFYSGLLGSEVNNYAYDFYSTYLNCVSVEEFKKFVVPTLAYYIVVARATTKHTRTVKFKSHKLQELDLTDELKEKIDEFTTKKGDTNDSKGKIRRMA